jgi:hypothetical protein
METDVKMDTAPRAAEAALNANVLRLIGELDEFKGAWRAIGRIAPDRLTIPLALRANVVVIGSIATAWHLVSGVTWFPILSGVRIGSPNFWKRPRRGIEFTATWPDRD